MIFFVGPPKKNLKISKATIIYNSITTRNGSYITAFFNHNNSKYEVSKKLLGKSYNGAFFYKYLYKRELFVLYDSTNPNNSIILDKKEDYEKFRIPYPSILDSLNKGFYEPIFLGL